jgi:vacuolar-type H+-ATPase subunit F/Vma7
LSYWKLCSQCTDITIQTIGTRYLRLDKNVEGLARLSPSIIREFNNYMVIGLSEQAEEIKAKARQMHREIIRISQSKLELARKTMERIIDAQVDPAIIREKVCFMIAGDVAYEMAHLEPRPESSTGKMVNGSDLDIVIICKDLPESKMKSLDASVYDMKYFLLSNPSHREEIDYVIKDISKVDKQLAFEDFESMIASKVLDESKFLCGSLDLFFEVKNMVSDRGIPGKLANMIEKATADREKARTLLLTHSDAINDKEMKQLFYTTEEKEEFF